MALTPPAIGTVDRSLTFALDQYMLRPAQANDLALVVERLTRECMSRRGMHGAVSERNAFDLLRDRSQRFGLVDEQLAGSLGYHWDVAPSASPPAGQVACTQTAYRRLGWAPGEFGWLRGLAEQTLRQTYADPRAAAVTARWSDCMAKTGFRYGRPLDAEADARWWGDRAAAVGAEEKRTAVADVRCKISVGFSDQLGVVLAEKQTAAVRQNKRRLDAFRRMASAAAAKADVLRGDRRSPEPGGPASAIPPGAWRARHAPA